MRSSTMPPAEEPDRRLSAIADHRPRVAQYQSGTQTRRVRDLNADAEPEPFVEIHPETARGLGIADGEHGAADHAARARRVEGAADRATSVSTRCSCRFTGAAAAAPTLLTNGALDPDLENPRVQGLRGALEKAPNRRTQSRPLQLPPLKRHMMIESQPHSCMGSIRSSGAGYRQAGAARRELTYMVPPTNARN